MASTTVSNVVREWQGDLQVNEGQLGQVVFDNPATSIVLTPSANFDKLYNTYVLTPSANITVTLPEVNTTTIITNGIVQRGWHCYIKNNSSGNTLEIITFNGGVPIITLSAGEEVMLIANSNVAAITGWIQLIESTDLQKAYNNGSGGTEGLIKITTADKAVIIEASTGDPIESIFSVQSDTGVNNLFDIKNIAVGDNPAMQSLGGSATASGAIALGPSSSAPLVGSIAIGDTAIAGGFGTNNIAIGGGAQTLGGNVNIAVGSNATAGADNTIALGTDSSASDNSCLAFGRQAQATADDAISIGRNTNATDIACLAFGLQSQATANRAIAIGNQATASNTSCVSVGGISTASGGNSAAYGDGAKATGNASTAIGFGSTASSLNTVAVGRSATASDDESTAIGGSATASGFESVAVGNTAIANGSDGSIAIGASATSSGTRSIVIGQNSTGSANGCALISTLSNYIHNTENEMKFGSAGGFKYIISTIDNQENELHDQGFINTNNLNLTNTIYTLDASTANTAFGIYYHVLGLRNSTGSTAGSAGDSWQFDGYCKAKNVAGTVTFNEGDQLAIRDTLGTDVTFNVTGTNLEIQCTGLADHDIDWIINIIIQEHTFS